MHALLEEYSSEEEAVFHAVFDEPPTTPPVARESGQPKKIPRQRIRKKQQDSKQPLRRHILRSLDDCEDSYNVNTITLAYNIIKQVGFCNIKL